MFDARRQLSVIVIRGLYFAMIGYSPSYKNPMHNTLASKALSLQDLRFPRTNWLFNYRIMNPIHIIHVTHVVRTRSSGTHGHSTDDDSDIHRLKH